MTQLATRHQWKSFLLVMSMDDGIKGQYGGLLLGIVGVAQAQQSRGKKGEEGRARNECDRFHSWFHI